MLTVIDCNSLSDIPKTEAGDGLDELWMENCGALTYMRPLDVYAKKLTIKTVASANWLPIAIESSTQKISLTTSHSNEY